jgi:hypothetical protein
VVKHFSHFIAIDWSGAQGNRHKSIAMAVTHAEGGPPVLVERKRGWSREEVLDVLRDELPDNSLVGFDLGISLPFADHSAFFPGWADSPADAQALWEFIEGVCAGEEDLAAGSFVDHPKAKAYFRRHGGREGEHFGGGRGRLRVTEHAQAEQGLKPTSNFNLVGAAQVGKSSLTGMRLLQALRGHLPVWPIDPLPQTGSVVVEIYTALAARAAGRSTSRAKIRDREELDEALLALGSAPLGSTGPIDDHSADALVTAAWMRAHANRPELWSPKRMTPQIARTEGWTFGVR